MYIKRILPRMLCLLLAFALLLPVMASCSSETAVMTFRDSSITSNMYSYWLSKYKYSFLSYYNSSLDSDEFWDTMATDDMTTEEYARQLIDENIKYILIGIQLFREYGLKIDSDTTQSINDDIQEKIDYYGGRSQLNSALSAYGINVDILKECYIAEEKLYAVYDYLYGSSGIEAVTDAQIDQYYEDNYSRIRYLVIYTSEKLLYDENGDYQYDSEGNVMTEELTEEEKAAKQEKINEAMICVAAGDDFGDIMDEYNEADMSSYPNGFYVLANELADFGFALVTETAMMDIGEIRRVDDEYATYIVEKLELIPRSQFDDSDTTQMSNLETYCIQQYYEEKFSSFAEEITVNDDELSKYSLRTAASNSTF